MLVLIGGAVGIGAASGLFTVHVLDQHAVEAGVRKILTENFELDVTDVRCPASQEIRPGNTFTCSVTFTSGDTGDAPVTVVDEDGEYTVGSP